VGIVGKHDVLKDAHPGAGSKMSVDEWTARKKHHPRSTRVIPKGARQLHSWPDKNSGNTSNPHPVAGSYADSPAHRESFKKLRRSTTWSLPVFNLAAAALRVMWHMGQR